MKPFQAALCAVLYLCALRLLAAGDAALLPVSGAAKGWNVEGAPKVFSGSALYNHSDGGAEAFLELGFDACTVQKYRKGPEELTLEVHRMTDPTAALGIYLANCGKETPEPSFAERHTVGRSQLIMVRGRYYIVATLGADGAAGPSLLIEFARRVGQRIPELPRPDVLDLLPKNGLFPGSMRIIRGPIGLQAVANLGEGDVLLLGTTVTAVAGDYPQGGSSPKTLLVADYPSSEAAAAALASLRSHVASLFEILEESDRGLIYKEASGVYGHASLDGRKLTVERGLLSRPPP